VAGNIVVAWVLTLPAAAAIGAIAYGVTNLLGAGAVGPALVVLLLVASIAAVFLRRSQQGAPVPAG
jgi:PiT family inorganic phosphate transporter